MSVDLSSVKFPDVMDLRTAAMFLGLSEMRIRTLVRTEGSGLKGEMIEKKWTFKKADLEAFKARPATGRKTGGPRGDGKAWIVNVPHTKLEAVKTFLKSQGIELQPRYDYDKMKAYRVKRDAAKKAEAPKTPGGPAQANKPAGK